MINFLKKYGIIFIPACFIIYIFSIIPYGFDNNVLKRQNEEISFIRNGGCNKTNFEIISYGIIERKSGRYSTYLDSYYVLKYNDKIYFYSSDNINKKIGENLSLYFRINNYWIVDQTDNKFQCKK
jgi:hypothetical protein